MYVILPLTFVSFDICINEFLAIGISPFFLIAAFFPVSRCIGTCLRTYCRDRHQPRRARYTEHKRSLCDGCISLSIAEGLVSGVSAFFFLPVSGPYFIPVFLTFKVFFFLFTLPCSQTCEQTFVNKAQNIFKVNFYSKGNPSFSSTFMNPSGSFFGRIRFHER